MSRVVQIILTYFTKLVEAASYATVTKNIMALFIRHNLICRYGIPERIMTDNGTNLNNKMSTELCEQFKIQHHNSSPYRPKMNGAVEAANKDLVTLIDILSGVLEVYLKTLDCLFVLCAGN